MSDPAGHFGDWQYGIYLRGMGMGERPELPVAWDAARAGRAREAPEAPRGYVWGGAGTGDTMRANLEALRAWRIVPRHLRAVETRDLSVEILGSRLPAPVALAPIGVQTIVHPEGELASARGAAAVGVPYTASTAATHPMESIAQAGGTRWYQLYWPKDDALCESLVRRAEAAGYTAIVVTLDTFFLGWRPTDLAQGYLPFLRAEGVGQFFSDPVFRSQLEHPPEEDVQAGVGHWVSVVNKVVQWDGPRVAARHHRPADRPEGGPPPRRCAQSPRGRHGRRGGVQPRRPPGRWCGGGAGCASRRVRRGRRAS